MRSRCSIKSLPRSTFTFRNLSVTRLPIAFFNRDSPRGPTGYFCVTENSMTKSSLDEKLALIHEHWRPMVVAQLNGQELKLVKLAGVFRGIGTNLRTNCFW